MSSDTALPSRAPAIPGTISRVLHSSRWMVLCGLIVRVLYIVAARSYRVIDIEHISLVNEMERLAYSLATGHGFSSPYVIDTGPSAWTPPLYPWIVSLAFRAFGVYSYASGFAVLLFNSIFSALTSWTIYRIARCSFGETVAVWSGWGWALFPYAIYWSVGWIWETSLSAFLLSLLFMVTLEMEGDDRLRSWCGYGVLWGVAALTNTSLIAWLPFSGCWLAYQLHRQGKRFVAPAVFGAVVFWMTLMPWLVRNYVVFGQPVFIRDNFGNELRAGNNPLAEGWMVPNYHVASDPVLRNLFRQMGEPAINAQQLDDAKEWIAEHPQQFLILSFRRFLFFWAGIPRKGLEQLKNLLFLASSLLAIGGLVLAVKRRAHSAFLFASLVLFYPLIYYITFPQPRYRHPIDPELAILAVFLLSTVAESVQSRRLAKNPNASVDPTLILAKLARWGAIAAALVIVIVAAALVNNNFSLRRQSRAEFDARLEGAIHSATDWIIVNRGAIYSNPSLMYMVSDMVKISGDPRLRLVLDGYDRYLDVIYPPKPLTPVWRRFAHPDARIPLIAASEWRTQGFELGWDSHAVAPDKVELSSADRADMFSPTRYSWGQRQHQLLALVMYRDFNGSPPELGLDSTINHLSEKIARDAHYDFRVSDSYPQRTAFIFAAGRPELVRRRWVERILDNQEPDGSWNYCWYGWCRGVLEFNAPPYPAHTTVQAAWALYQLKYRYPEWIRENYR
ncbi:MAG: glycosyltransferase family 39 protein [Candidatus Korobacteraceae bacterium]